MLCWDPNGNRYENAMGNVFPGRVSGNMEQI